MNNAYAVIHDFGIIIHKVFSQLYNNYNNIYYTKRFEMCSCYKEPSKEYNVYNEVSSTCSGSGNHHFTYFNYQLQPLHLTSYTFMSHC